VNDYSLTAGKDGRWVAHKPSCPVVELHRSTGYPVMTMLGCEGELPNDIKRCNCLTNRPTQRRPRNER
jgi:hypothetical protein